MVLGKQQNPDQLYYGPAFVDSRIRLRGNMDLPRIDAYVKLRDKSKVTVTIPQDEPGLANREGVMVFVDKDAPVDSAMRQMSQSFTGREAAVGQGLLYSVSSGVGGVLGSLLASRLWDAHGGSVAFLAAAAVVGAAWLVYALRPATTAPAAG